MKHKIFHYWPSFKDFKVERKKKKKKNTPILFDVISFNIHSGDNILKIHYGFFDVAIGSVNKHNFNVIAQNLS